MAETTQIWKKDKLTDAINSVNPNRINLKKYMSKTIINELLKTIKKIS